METANRNGTYQMRMVPRDEIFSDWKNLFSVIGHNGPVRSLQQHSRVVVEQFRSLCSPINSQVFLVHAGRTRVMQVFACGNYSRDRHTGQIAVVVSMQNATGLVTMSRQWRTKSFQSAIQISWPISKAELDHVLVELARSQLIPIKGNSG